MSDLDLHTKVFTCRHVVDEGAPIVYAVRDDDGDLQVLCGAAAHADADVRSMPLGEMLLEHPSIADIARLETEQAAARVAPDEPWKVLDRKST